jgi:hypothetical protein
VHATDFHWPEEKENAVHRSTGLSGVTHTPTTG